MPIRAKKEENEASKLIDASDIEVHGGGLYYGEHKQKSPLLISIKSQQSNLLALSCTTPSPRWNHDR